MAFFIRRLQRAVLWIVLGTLAVVLILSDLRDRFVDVEYNNFGDNDNVALARTRQADAGEEQLKTILMWNDAYGVRKYDIGWGREPFIKFKCPETRCVATANRSFLAGGESQFDAILIHQRGIDWNDMPDPAKRRPEQRYVFWVMESAMYPYMDVSRLDGYFNWTMTYRRDSDFWRPYGRVHQTRPLPARDHDSLKKAISDFGVRNAHLARRNDSGEARAVWFVSHCATQARREKYAKALAKYMPVDIYGSCGKLKCPRGEDEAFCDRMAENNYKFFLSFENSVCEDYVTEKFFKALRYNIVPLVFGGANYSAIAPPNSFINVIDHPSPRKLAKYLNKLSANEAKYAEFFWWKDYYEVRDKEGDAAQAYCQLCQRLHNQKEPRKVYDNMLDWWISQSQCKKLKLSNLK